MCQSGIAGHNNPQKSADAGGTGERKPGRSRAAASSHEPLMIPPPHIPSAPSLPRSTDPPPLAQPRPPPSTTTPQRILHQGFVSGDT
ncbi:unnamed protein product [Boreogadus saida]